jgi:hypothetical protein
MAAAGGANSYKERTFADFDIDPLTLDAEGNDKVLDLIEENNTLTHEVQSGVWPDACSGLIAPVPEAPLSAGAGLIPRRNATAMVHVLAAGCDTCWNVHSMAGGMRAGGQLPHFWA